MSSSAHPSPAERALVISVHDVSPHTFSACAQIATELEALGIRRSSLLVVPDHHRRGLIREHTEFCEWLRGLAARGHETVTHGYHHRRARRSGESAAQKLTTRMYTADEGEFYDLDFALARELVARGNTELRELGLEPRGFIAPAWLLSVEAEAALRDLGVQYTTRLGSVSDLQTGRVWHSQSLVWSVRAAWRRLTSLAWNALLFRALRDRPLLRISIHPVDIAHPAIWRQICDMIQIAGKTREATTYRGWIEAQRLVAKPIGAQQQV